MTMQMAMAFQISAEQEQAIQRLLLALIDQERARVLVPAHAQASGYWFGGGNLVEAPDGTLWLTGRYRDAGDSRLGLGAGQRGLECTLFRSTDRGRSFERMMAFTKADLSAAGREVISIEGTALHWLPDGSVELFISSEKERAYPDGLGEYQKPGTGVWSIDRLSAARIESLAVSSFESVLENFDQPGYLHVKDPVVFDAPDGSTALVFCTHPFTWASSNSGLALRPKGTQHFDLISWEVASRGTTWDVAATRITNRMRLPAQGVLAELGEMYAYLYDGAECMRRLDENPYARSRPRGYSCEELGGALLGAALPTAPLQRLSRLQPLFVAPHGSGSSRYVSTLVLKEGILATWQQSQPDESQPLVGHFLSNEDIEQILRA